MSGDSAESSLSEPFKCPLTKCHEIISPSLLFSHFLRTHQKEDDKVDVKEVDEGEKISLFVSVAPDYLKLDKNVCLGILAYQLDDKHSNVLLTPFYQAFETHHPILIMACRGNYVKMYEEEPDFLDPEADFIVVWVIMPTNSKRKLMATLTVHDENLTKSLSSLVHVRNASASQNFLEFMQTDADLLIINSGFLEDISSMSNIYVEVSIAENLL